jgi:hypothetical protein
MQKNIVELKKLTTNSQVQFFCWQFENFSNKKVQKLRDKQAKNVRKKFTINC